jgi:hypothetical protein
MFGVGSVSKFLTMSELDWQSFKDSVEELRATFPGLHQHPQTAAHVCGLPPEMDEGILVDSHCWQQLPLA